MTKHTLICQSCNSEIAGEIYHLGFSNMEAIYCTNCPNVLLIKDLNFYNKNGIKILNLKAGDKGWQAYDRHLLPYFKKVESLFPDCSCGGKFEYMAAPRCPNCNEYIMGNGYDDKPIYRNIRHVFISKESIYI